MLFLASPSSHTSVLQAAWSPFSNSHRAYFQSALVFRDALSIQPYLVRIASSALLTRSQSLVRVIHLLLLSDESVILTLILRSPPHFSWSLHSVATSLLHQYVSCPRSQPNNISWSHLPYYPKSLLLSKLETISTLKALRSAKYCLFISPLCFMNNHKAPIV